jgi:hypothetical protein
MTPQSLCTRARRCSSQGYTSSPILQNLVFGTHRTRRPTLLAAPRRD